MQSRLATSAVNVDIERNNANANKARADGEATYIRETGAAKSAEVEAVGLAKAKAYKAQVEALAGSDGSSQRDYRTRRRKGQPAVRAGSAWSWR